MDEAMGTTSTESPVPAKAGKVKKATAKSAAKASAPKPSEKEKAAKPVLEPKAKREKELLDGEVVVFAFRLGSNDRDRIHAAAGPAGATRFVRSAALAAASGDSAAFDALVKQAKANQK